MFPNSASTTTWNNYNKTFLTKLPLAQIFPAKIYLKQPVERAPTKTSVSTISSTAVKAATIANRKND
jgi:hypothetical protein